MYYKCVATFPHIAALNVGQLYFWERKINCKLQSYEVHNEHEIM